MLELGNIYYLFHYKILKILNNEFIFSYFVSRVPSLADCNGDLLELLLNMAETDPSSYIRYCINFCG